MPRDKSAEKARKARVASLTARSVASGARTRGVILDAAETLFATYGFDGASMRQIGQAAGVPLALVAYHFKSKLGLYRAVFERRLAIIGKIRNERVAAIKPTADKHDMARKIARALVEPIVELEHGPRGQDVARLIAREINDPRESERGIIQEHFDPIAHVIIAKLRKCFPDVDPRSIYWSFMFASGALAINHALTGRIERLSDGACRSSDVPALLDNLVEFIAGGLIANFERHPLPAKKPRR